MYVRPDGRRRSSRSISIPQNYSGNAFTEKEPILQASESEATEEAEEESPPAEEVSATVHEEPSERKGFLSGLSGLSENDDLILMGLILLLSQDGFADDIIPILLIMLFFRK